MSDQRQTKENETMNAAQVLVRCLENEGSGRNRTYACYWIPD